jgi:spermidine synthase
MSSDATGMFINETHTDAAVWQFRVSKMLLEGKTKYQTYQICEIPRFGKSLFLDYNIQTSLMDEHVFHECMTQPAMTLHPNPQRIVVCGGGEGATLREALKHNTIKDAIMVDIDEELVDMVKVHMPEWHQGAFEDSRTTLLHEDARGWLKAQPKGSIDVIISDLPNPHEEGPGQMLFTEEYFQICADALTDDGVLALQAGTANQNYPECMLSCIKTVESMDCFAHCAGYYGLVTTFFQPWGFVLASKKHDPLLLTAEEIRSRFTQRGVKTRYYTPDFHHAVFALPPYLAEQMDKARILTDADPFIWTA